MSQKTQAEATQYLRKVLQMNPNLSASLIVSNRGHFLGTRKEKRIESDLEFQSRRQRARQQIDKLRNGFWTLNPAEIRSCADAIRVRDFPELQPAVDRMRLASAFRTEFDRLAKHPLTHTSLFLAFKRIVMLPPREAGSIKASYLQTVADSESLKSIKAMVRMMKSEFPNLYRMEADWLNEVARIQGRAEVSDSDGGSFDFEFPIPGWLIYVFLFLVGKIFIAVLRSS